MRTLRFSLLTLLLLSCAPLAKALDLPFFRSGDPLAQRDEWGLLRQLPDPNPTDFAPREPFRLHYYLQSRRSLTNDPAYVGAMQVALTRKGYYCGAIDGVFTEDVAYAIARLQKAHHMRVTGNLTLAVRRALHLP